MSDEDQRYIQKLMAKHGLDCKVCCNMGGCLTHACNSHVPDSAPNAVCDLREEQWHHCILLPKEYCVAPVKSI